MFLWLDGNDFPLVLMIAAEAKFETSVGTPAWMAPEVLRGDE